MSEAREIIEFPCVLVDARSLTTISEFRSFVRPRGTVSAFCTSLTGITEADVLPAPPLSEVLVSFTSWLQGLNVLAEPYGRPRLCAVTCGDWDLKTQLPSECRAKGLEVPLFLREWINIKHPFCEHYLGKKTGLGLAGMLQRLNIPLEGRHHSGFARSHSLILFAASECSICCMCTCRY
jgi:inhibitor of KinA sporulation pathway (predicted exonuclease)